MSGFLKYQIQQLVSQRLRPPSGLHWFQVGDLKLLLEWPSGLAKALHYKGVYHPETVKYLESSLKPSDVCIDIGAHVGYITAIMARNCAHVIAFEPNPETRRVLLMNLMANNIENVSVQHEAISDENGKARFFVNVESMYSGLIGHNGLREIIEVETATLDSLFDGASLIKIDVEGAESRVLKGMKDIMRDNPDLRLIVEVEPDRKGFSEDVYDLLEGWRFRNLDRLNLLCWRD